MFDDLDLDGGMVGSRVWELLLAIRIMWKLKEGSF